MPIGSTGCVPYDPRQRTAYGYVPSLAAGIVYCVIFGLSMIAHTFQAIKTRALWNLVFAVGCLSMFSSPQLFLLLRKTRTFLLYQFADLFS
jgi:hypothetical protein